MSAGLTLAGPGAAGGRAQARLHAAELPSLGPVGLAWIGFLLLSTSVASVRGLDALERTAWLAADAGVVVVVLMWRQRIATAVAANWIFVSWALLAILSTAWSLTPGISFYHGLQLLMTILVGLVLRITLGLSGILRVLFIYLLILEVLSTLAGVLMPRTFITPAGDWTGVFSHKNVLGGTMALQMICAACLFLEGWHRSLTLAAFLAAFGLLLLSHSATALMASCVSLAPLAAVWAWRRGARVAGFCFGLAIALVGVAISVVATRGGELSGALLSGVGKDATLTGRTVLWQFGIDQFWREPLLGVGYKAYWESPLTTARYLHFTVQQKLWFFHNNFIDVAVAFGIVGLTLFAAGLIYASQRVLRVFLRKPGFIEAWPVLFMVQMLLFVCFENVLFSNHSLAQALLVAVMPLPARHLATPDR
ncbi:O-antigen ligase family protein [Methylobacterium sp. A54F]